jgi:hypothetical protein
MLTCSVIVSCPRLEWSKRLGAFLVGIWTVLFGLGCTPRHDWRVVNDPDGRWSATLPGKPVEVTRQLTLPTAADTGLPISLRLYAVRVGETRFTIGLAEPVSTSTGSALEEIRQGLETAMLRNLRATVSSRGQAPHRFGAKGEIQVEPNAPPVAAFLEMQTFIHAGAVIEALVVGPVSEQHGEAIEQFFESLRVPAR